MTDGMQQQDAQEEIFASANTVKWLGTLGLPKRIVKRISKVWGDDARLHITTNPYVLMARFNCQWDVVDRIALKEFCFSKTDYRRLIAAVYRTLNKALSEGHCYMTLHGGTRSAAKFAGVSQDDVLELCEGEHAEGFVVVEDGKRVMLEGIYEAEVGVAEKLCAMAEFEDVSIEVSPLKGLELSEEQLEAVTAACCQPVTVITGGPGTGKTTCIQTICANLDRAGVRYALCAPTGKAARRMEEAAEKNAATIHRLLGWTGGGSFAHHALNPLNTDVVIVDESSMIDIRLAYWLLRALEDHVRVVFVGDADQLPPVGPGAFFRDVIASEQFPVVRLTQLFRQSERSWVCRNAPRILAGGRGLELKDMTDFEWWEVDNPEGIREAVTDLMRRLRKEYPWEKLQVLTPMKKEDRPGTTWDLNGRLQHVFNPDSFGIKVQQLEVREHDRVLQTRNNYDLGVMNGELGTVEMVSTDPYGAEVFINGMARPYLGANLYDLQLAYALTIHKCVAPDTIVWTDRGMFEFEELLSQSPSYVATGEGLCEYEKPFMLDDIRACLRIRTKDGYAVTVTPEHKLMSWTGDSYEAVAAGDLDEGCFLRLALAEGFGVGVAQTLPPADGRHDVRACVYPTPSVLTEAAAEFLGLFVADGTVYRAGFRLVKRHRDVVERFASLVLELFHVKAEVTQGSYVEDTPGECWSCEVNSTYLSAWLRRIDGLNPHRKAVPQQILRAPEAVQARFLRGLFEDGTVNVKGDSLDHIEWSNCSASMVRLVQIMLLRFGIISSRRRHRQQSLLYIYGQSAKRFGERVGFVSAFKSERVGLPAGAPTKYVVPISRVETARLMSVSARQNARSRGYVSRATLLAEGFSPEGDHLRFHHDRIVAIEPVQSRAGCMSVTESGRFLQNGFDGCNSQGSEWPIVIVVCHSAHGFMLSRQLLYTAITRAKERLFIVGDRKGIDKALRTVRDSQRATTLVRRLQADA